MISAWRILSMLWLLVLLGLASARGRDSRKPLPTDDPRFNNHKFPNDDFAPKPEKDGPSQQVLNQRKHKARMGNFGGGRQRAGRSKDEF
jgi:hypothetical protein